jgi:uncharacterized membrane protein
MIKYRIHVQRRRGLPLRPRPLAIGATVAAATALWITLGGMVSAGTLAILAALVLWLAD